MSDNTPNNEKEMPQVQESNQSNQSNQAGQAKQDTQNDSRKKIESGATEKVLASVEGNKDEEKSAPQQDSTKSDASTPAPSAKKGKRSKRTIFKGQAHVQCTYNNTIVTVTDLSGGVLGWSSAGILAFKGAKKSTPYAATQIVADVIEKIRKYHMKEIEIYIKGVGSGREAVIRAFANNGFTITLIKDITPIPHNGCRPRRPRRV